MDFDKSIAVYYMWVDRNNGKNIGLTDITNAIDKLTVEEYKFYNCLRGAYLHGYSKYKSIRE